MEEPQLNLFDTIASLQKNEGASWYRILWKIFSVLAAGAGVIPNVMFSSDFAKELFGDDAEFLILWAQIANGGVNIPIFFTSLDQIPEVIQRLPDIVKKLDAEIQAKYGKNISRPKIITAALLLLVINIGSFLSNLEFANQTSQKFTNAAMSGFIYYSQLIAATALVLRSTLNLAIPFALPEQEETAIVIKHRILSELNSCLDEDERLDNEKLEALSNGKLMLGVSETVTYGLALLPIIIALAYSGAFGVAAFTAVSSISWLKDSSCEKGIAWGGAITSGISKFTLLAKADLSLTGDIAKVIALCTGGENIFPELSGSISLNTGFAVALFCFGVWNTFFGAAWIVQGHFVSNFIRNIVAQKVISGIIGGVGALPINFGDSFNVLKKFGLWAQPNSWKQPIAEHNLYIKGLMKMFAETPNSEIINLFIDKRYLCPQSAMEEGRLLNYPDHTQQYVMNNMGGVLNQHFFDWIQELKNLQTTSWDDKNKMYKAFAKIPDVPLTEIVEDIYDEADDIGSINHDGSLVDTKKTHTDTGPDTTCCQM